MQSTGSMKIEKLLLESGVINSERLERIREAERRTGADMESLLVSEGIIKPKELLNLKATAMGVEFVDLENIIVAPEVVSKVSADVINKYDVFPFKIKNNLLYLAMTNPDDLFIVDEIKVFTQMEIKPYLADDRLIGKCIRQFYGNEISCEHSTAKTQKEISEPGKGSKVSSIIGRNQKNAASGVNAAVAAPAPVSPVENFSNISDHIDRLLSSVISKTVKLENVTDIHIDTVNKNIKVVLAIKYEG